uniref:Uncharacterized protein n=1 Tax=Anopheles atroparvus TaxID=41427 RepID=A0AAG5DK49_ANOAO
MRSADECFPIRARTPDKYCQSRSGTPSSFGKSPVIHQNDIESQAILLRNCSAHKTPSTVVLCHLPELNRHRILSLAPPCRTGMNGPFAERHGIPANIVRS